MTLAASVQPVRHILVVDDDAALREQVSAYLADHGYVTHAADSGAAMDRILAEIEVDLVILDVRLPGEDGLSICRRLAESGGPAIVVVSGLSEEVDRVLGLELGADDYLPKPCSPRELLARVRAVIRRLEEPRHGGARRPRVYRFQGFSVDMTRRQVLAPNDPVLS